MIIRIIAPVRNFDLIGLEFIKIEDFILTKEEGKRQELTDDEYFYKTIGETMKEVIDNNVFFYYQGTNNINVLKGFNKEQYPIILLQYFSSIIQKLWWIKDNSSFISHCIFEVLEDGPYYRHLPVISTSLSPAYNCLGECEKISCEENEIDRVKELYFALNKRATLTKDDLQTIDNYKRTITTATPYLINYFTTPQDRFERARIYLDRLRKEADIIIKISFYVQLFECLFTIQGSKSISRNVSQRITAFLGGDITIKKDNFSKIKQAYDIRSTFVHGSKIKKVPIEYSELCKFLDKTTRDILLKILPDTSENEIFKIAQTNNHNAFEKCMSKLVKREKCEKL